MNLFRPDEQASGAPHEERPTADDLANARADLEEARDLFESIAADDQESERGPWASGTGVMFIVASVVGLAALHFSGGPLQRTLLFAGLLLTIFVFVQLVYVVSARADRNLTHKARAMLDEAEIELARLEEQEHERDEQGSEPEPNDDPAGHAEPRER